MDELNLVIRSTFDATYWVVAEVANVSIAARGHMYLELVEKDQNQIVAKARANLWSYKKKQIISSFEEVTKQSVKTGMKLLLQLSVEFHPVYGISFQIHDIDPAYSLGELERERQETIKSLEKEGLLDFNKQYILPEVIQKIAIISSKTAAGYQDFLTQLQNNSSGYTFQSELFPSTMQGDQAGASIIKALEKVEKNKTSFDVLVIIRGGGSNLDLACFDEYELNARLAQCILPVLSGIGHERDTSVTDMVAHTRLKTPTAVAAFILDHNNQFEEQLQDLFYRALSYSKSYVQNEIFQMKNWSKIITDGAQYQIISSEHFLKTSSFKINKGSINLINKSHIKLKQEKANLRLVTMRYRERQRYLLRFKYKQLELGVKDFTYLSTKEINQLKKELLNTILLTDFQKNKLDYLNHMIKLSDPNSILKRGFSITRKNGKAITHIHSIEKGELIETQLTDGSFKSIIKEKKQ